jgi:peptidoglycan/LPS O-acetylase OafA/YrhL
MTAKQSPEVRHLPTLDGVRAIAAYGVIATHVGFNTGRSQVDRPFAPLLARLDFGVTLFFLLSGYLLFRPFAVAALHERPSPRVLSFWWRRLLRIAPAYWLTIVVVLAVLTTRHPTGHDWRSYLLLTETYDNHNVDPSLTHMWTLAVEISFYALLPALAAAGVRLAGRRWSRLSGQLAVLASMAVLALAANLVAHAVEGDGARGLLWLPAYLDWFALGMLLAVVSAHPAEPAPWMAALRGIATAPVTCWLVGASLFWLATLPLAGPRSLVPPTAWEWTMKHYLYGAAAFFLLAPVALGRTVLVDRLLGNRFIGWLGTISYGVYLWHLPLLIAIQRWMGWPVFTGHFLGLYVLTVLAATGAAATSWYLFERPLLRRFSRPWRRGADQRDDAQREREQTQQLSAGAAGGGMS